MKIVARSSASQGWPQTTHGDTRRWQTSGGFLNEHSFLQSVALLRSMDSHRSSATRAKLRRGVGGGMDATGNECSDARWQTNYAARLVLPAAATAAAPNAPSTERPASGIVEGSVKRQRRGSHGVGGSAWAARGKACIQRKSSGCCRGASNRDQICATRGTALTFALASEPTSSTGRAVGSIRDYSSSASRQIRLRSASRPPRAAARVRRVEFLAQQHLQSRAGARLVRLAPRLFAHAPRRRNRDARSVGELPRKRRPQSDVVREDPRIPAVSEQRQPSRAAASASSSSPRSVNTPARFASVNPSEFLLSGAIGAASRRTGETWRLRRPDRRAPSSRRRDRQDDPARRIRRPTRGNASTPSRSALLQRPAHLRPFSENRDCRNTWRPPWAAPSRQAPGTLPPERIRTAPTGRVAPGREPSERAYGRRRTRLPFADTSRGPARIG